MALKSVTKKKLKNPKHKGFTLIELLVVLFIIAVISGGVVFGAGYASKRNAVKTLAEKLHQVLPLAKEYAALNAVTLKLQIRKSHYSFFELQENGINGREIWRLVNQPDFLKSQSFSESILIQQKSLNVSDQEVLPDVDYYPEIEILPTMDMTPTVLSMGTESDPDQYHLSVEQNGQVELKQLR